MHSLVTSHALPSGQLQVMHSVYFCRETGKDQSKIRILARGAATQKSLVATASSLVSYQTRKMEEIEGKALKTHKKCLCKHCEFNDVSNL